jgi:RNA polymerase sigma-70 factor (ECF subfamily)
MDLRTDILPHSDRLFRMALNILMDATEAEDVVQDTMLRAWERRAEWESIENVQAWLTQICKNLALDRKKKMSRTESMNELATATLTTSPSGDTEGQLALLHQLIAELPPPLDDLVRLRDIEGFTYREIAEQLSLTEDQVRVYLHRARGRIRQRYEALQA